jgi:hypothetical protein
MGYIFRKDAIFGATLTVGELLISLKNEKFKDDEIYVTMRTEEHYALVSGIYICKECNKLHLIGNNIDEEGKPLFTETHIIELLNEISNDIIAFGYILSKKEIIEALEKVKDKSIGATIETMLDETTYTLTKVEKCDSEECNAPHLKSSYDENAFEAN